MASKNKSQDLGLGEFIVPLIDLMSIIIMKGTELLGIGIMWGLNKYIFKRNPKEAVRKVERHDLKVKKATLNEDSLGFSISKKRNLKADELVRKRHTMICGASGFGKSVLLDVLMYDDLRKDKPVIFLDPKGDNKSLNQFINLCRITGREFQIFSEYYNGVGSVSLNPVKEGTATNIADRVHYSFNWSEEHYETLCYRALKKTCQLLLDKNERVSYKRIFEKLKEVSNPKNKEKLFDRKNIEGIIARIENIIDTDFGVHLGPEGLSFNEVWDRKKCIYIGMPVLGYPKVARALGKIIMGDLSYSIYDAYKHLTVDNEDDYTPVGVYIDELSAVITDEFIELLNKSRGVKVEFTFAFQTPSDINKVSPELCDQILENASNRFVLKQRMESGANLFAEAIGTEIGKRETMRIQDGEEQAQGSQRTVEELIVHHNIIKNLNQGQGILLRHSPTAVDLLNIKYIDPKVVNRNVKFLEKNKFINKSSKKVLVCDDSSEIL
ncbi:type IV secretion system DNA-binding domain-containing protein [Bacteriovoracaceae bacterium]|nr:type IV secretion system DNA-binding domain-containing protein [Bacteriovoracaceae bacterium]